MAARKGKRSKPFKDEPSWLQFAISSHELGYQFGVTPPKEVDRFRDLLWLDISGVVHWPEEWRGAEVEGTLRADRNVETVLRLGKPPPGQHFTNDWLHDPTDDIGLIDSIPATRAPKGIVFSARLPQDMLLHAHNLIRAEVWKASSIYFVRKPPPANPKARWIRTIDFQCAVDTE